MTILLADENTLFRAAILPLLTEAAGNGAAVIEADSALATIARIEATADLGLVILSTAIGARLDDILAAARTHCPTAKLILLLDREEPEVVRSALAKGADGCMMKSMSSSAFVCALTFVLAGGTYIPPSMLGYVLSGGDQPRPLHRRLTVRERQTLELLRHGLSNRDIAKELDIRESTLKSHVTRLYRKLGVHTRVQAARLSLAA